jgi:hypothetical protein
MIALDTVCRLAAGQVRFRLALAWQAGLVQTPAYAFVVIVPSLFLLRLSAVDEFNAHPGVVVAIR